MEESTFSETTLHLYQTVRRHSPVDSSHHFYCSEMPEAHASKHFFYGDKLEFMKHDREHLYESIK